MAPTFRDHFSGHADSYASSRPDYPPELFRWIASRAPDRRRAWDCATGNGQAARPLADLFTEVIATDASQQQLDAVPDDVPDNVMFRRADATDSGLDAGSCDLVTSAQAVHWFADTTFWDEARRVLAPGGILAVWCYVRLTVSPAIDELVEHLYSDIVGPYWPPDRHHIDVEYRELPFPFPELEAPKFEIRRSWSLEQLEDYLGTWSSTRRYIAERGKDPVALIHDGLAAHWPAGTRDVVWPVHLRVGARP